MTHFATLVLLDGEVSRENAELVVTPVLEPYREENEWFEDGTRFDWFSIGGRWTGALTGGYEPADDILNYEVCWLCDGSGVRPNGLEEFGADWVEWCNGCNGCSGRGLSLVHPADYQPFEPDVVPVARVTPDFLPTAIVTPDGKWLEEGRVGWFGTRKADEDGQEPKPEAVWAAAVRAIYEQHPEATAVLVDCHV